MKKPTTNFAFECPSWWQRCFAADSTVHRSVSWSTWDWAWVERCEDTCEHKLAGGGGGERVLTPLLTHTLWRNPKSIQAWYTVHCLETEKIPQSLVSLRKLKSLCGWTLRGRGTSKASDVPTGAGSDSPYADHLIFVVYCNFLKYIHHLTSTSFSISLSVLLLPMNKQMLR